MGFAQRSLRDGNLPDILFAAALLAVHFVVYYHQWPIWEDQAIYHYMAWGLEHGLVPYRDTIDVNWPGIVLVHAVARAISGADAIGLRLLDCLFALVLCGATSTLLSAYGIARPLRLLAIVAYLSSYFATGYESTAQRESFMFPLVAVGLTACLTHHTREAPLSIWTWAGVGAITGFGFWIKPTLGPIVVAAVVVMLLVSARRGATAWRETAAMIAGVAATSALMLVFLFVWCDPSGFYTWGIEMAFGPNASAFPWSLRFRNVGRFLFSLPLPWSTILALVGLAAAAVTALAKTAGGGAARLADSKRHAVVMVGGLVVLTLATVLLQGKTNYHFHSVRWTFALAGCILLAEANSRVRFPRAMQLAAVMCAVIVVLDLAVRPSDWSVPRRGSVIAEVLKKRLAPSDQVVTFGFSTTFLSDVERKTPFPVLASIVLYECANDDRSYEVRIGEAYAAAVANPDVKVVLIEHLSWSVDGFSQDMPMIKSQDVAYEFLPVSRLEELGFVSVDTYNFDMYLRDQSPKDIEEISDALKGN